MSASYTPFGQLSRLPSSTSYNDVNRSQKKRQLWSIEKGGSKVAMNELASKGLQAKCGSALLELSMIAECVGKNLNCTLKYNVHMGTAHVLVMRCRARKQMLCVYVYIRMHSPKNQIIRGNPNTSTKKSVYINEIEAIRIHPLKNKK